MKAPTELGNGLTAMAYGSSGSAVVTGWLGTVMHWDWSTISFIVGVLAAVITAAVNIWYKRKTYALMERLGKEGKVYYEYKE